MISFKSTGDFSKTINYLEKLKDAVHLSILDKYGKRGVEALAEATPKDTGLTAESWDYKITRGDNFAKLTFTNSNIQNGAPVAILLQYGHATNGGGWVEGKDYINPAIRPIFEELANSAWKEVTEL